MPPLLPFRGLRPDPAITGPLSDVVCPPYDVISQSQRAELLARSPYNVVRVELPAGDYAGAASALEEWKREGALVREARPALYGYRMSYRDQQGQPRETLGVMGALVLEPPGAGVLPHEQTTPKDKTDRLELIRAAKANTSPIWCLCTKAGLSNTVAATYRGSSTALEDREAEQEDREAEQAVDDEEVVHELWPIYEPAAHAAVGQLTSAAPLLVADGHHRYETALAYQAEMGSAPGPTSGDTTGPNAVLSLVVELADRYLQVRAIHRVVSGLPAGTDVLATFEKGFLVSPAASSGPALLEEMELTDAIGVVTTKGAFLARSRPGRPSAAFALDSSRVDAALAELPPHELGYEHDLGRALAGVRTGRLDAAVFCRPATVAQIAATARGGERMPPKTTFFWPKPRTGMVLRDW